MRQATSAHAPALNNIESLILSKRVGQDGLDSCAEFILFLLYRLIVPTGRIQDCWILLHLIGF